MGTLQLELCADSVEAVQAAAEYDFQRVELCSALELGGLTPSVGLVDRSLAVGKVQIHPIIRPRGGGFCYSDTEIETMHLDIVQLLETGAHGVVFGSLDAQNSIDIDCCKHLISAAKAFSAEATFHRAFDLVSDPISELDKIIDLGFDRLLTSGLAKSADLGISVIQKLVTHADGRIQIMAGSGVNPQNAAMMSDSGVSALHFTARKFKSDDSSHNFGTEFGVDLEKIKGILHQVRP